jgi:hypothetical protein
MGIAVHSPPYQFWTAEYHNNVNGKKRNPSKGQNAVEKALSNQCVKSQSNTITILGTSNAKIRNITGINPKATRHIAMVFSSGLMRALRRLNLTEKSSSLLSIGHPNPPTYRLDLLKQP